MAEDKRNAPTLRVWAPDPGQHSEEHARMQKLVHLKGKNGETLESILQANGVTDADIMPPRKRGTYVPDEHDDYEIFSKPKTLQIDVEGVAINKAIREATGLYGFINDPFDDEHERAIHAEKNGLQVIHGIGRTGAERQ